MCCCAVTLTAVLMPVEGIQCIACCAVVGCCLYRAAVMCCIETCWGNYWGLGSTWAVCVLLLSCWGFVTSTVAWPVGHKPTCNRFLR